MTTFLVSFAVVLTVPLLAGSFSYTRVLGVLEEVSHEAGMNNLRQVADGYDTILEDTRRKLILLTENALVRESRYYGRRLTSSDLFTLWRLYQGSTGDQGISMARYLGLDTWNFLVYYPENDLVLSLESHYSLEADYGSLIRIGDLGLGEFRRAYLGEPLRGVFFPETEVTVEGRSFRAIPYVESMPVGQPALHTGTVIYFLAAAPLKRAFASGTPEGGALLLVAGGRLLARAGSLEGPEGDRTVARALADEPSPRGYRVVDGYVVVRHVSTSSGLTYVSLSPMRLVFDRLHRTRLQVWLFFSASLVIGLVLVVFLSLSFSRPLELAYRELALGAREVGGGVAGPFTHLARAARRLVSANRFLAEELAQSQEQLRMAFFSRLIDGSFQDESHVSEFLAHADLDMTGRSYAALLVSMYDSAPAGDDPELPAAGRALVMTTLREAVGSQGYIHMLDRDRLAVFFRFASDDPAECTRRVEEVVARLQSTLEGQSCLAVSCAAGSVCRTVPDLNRCYEEAREVAAHNDLLPRRAVLWFDALGGHERRFTYPLVVENAIIENARYGNADEIDRLLDRVYAENYVERSLAAGAAQLLLSETLATLHKVLNDLSPEPAGYLEAINVRRDDVRVFFGKLKSSYRRICAERSAETPDHIRNIIDRAERIIRERYPRTDFSLLSLGQELGVSYPHLSRFYHRQRKQTLFDFLESVRIEQAIVLLSSGEATVAEVSTRVGYASDRSFRRAFKRVTGSSPRSYPRRGQESVP